MSIFDTLLPRSDERDDPGLLKIFNELDINHDGRLDASELHVRHTVVIH
jgi:hypothetical protein